MSVDQTDTPGDYVSSVNGTEEPIERVAVAAIEVDSITKSYRRVAHSHRFLTLKSAFVGRNLFRVLSPEEVFTALDDVNLSVAPGETLGVIGGNGAGKSTLLKIVAGTTRPTHGRVQVNGRISALIELGAGFHPEISGRENVFINGIMLGLTRKQLAERFDDIVAFAELEDFIDNPVKTYSSGMYMRLGFSVAIHVDPDVLLIDEVLAVGDEGFVHKCLAKIGDFRRRGKTILLVTHGMDTVRSLCDRAVWLQGGQVQACGDPARVVDSYLAWVAAQEEYELTAAERRRIEDLRQISVAEDTLDDVVVAEAPEADGEGKIPYEPGRWGNQTVRIEHVSLLDSDGKPGHVFRCGEPVTIELQARTRGPVDDFVFGIGIYDASGVCCYGTNTDIERYISGCLDGPCVVRVVIPELNLIQGTYYLDVATHSREGTPYDYHRGLYNFRTSSLFSEVGVVRLPHRWEFEGSVTWKQDGGIPRNDDGT